MCKGIVPPRTSFRPYSIAITGEELDAFLARHQPAFDRVIYIGDGSNDFCPILRLRRCVHPTSRHRSLLTCSSEDIVFCRTYRGLQKRIQKEGESAGLKCQVYYWAGAWEVEELFNKL